LWVDPSLEQPQCEATAAGILSRTLVTSLTLTQNCCYKGKNQKYKRTSEYLNMLMITALLYQQKTSRNMVKRSKDGNTFIHIFSGNPPLEVFATSTLLENSVTFEY
jgi:hypothetical protein